jgi:hypothetical protein
MRKNNIFGVCIDFLLKLLYNGKRMLCNFSSRRAIVAVAVSVCAILLPWGGVVPLSADSGLAEEVVFSASAEVFAEGDGVLLSLIKNGGQPFCGAMLELQYPEELTLSEVASVDFPAGARLSYRDRNGSLRILIDSPRNMELSGVVAKFRFSLKKECEDISALSRFAFRGVSEVYAFAENASLVSLSVRTEDGEIAAKSEKFCETPQLLCASQTEDGKLSVTVISHLCFAGGFEISVIEPGEGRLTRYTEVGILSQEGSRCADVVIPQDGIVCLIVSPLGYRRDGVRYGDMHVFCFLNGVLLE